MNSFHKHLLKASKYAKRALDCLKISLSDIEGEEAKIFKSKLEKMSASITKKQGESDDQTPNSTLIKNDFFEPIATMPDGIANEFHSYMMELLADSLDKRRDKWTLILIEH